MALRIYNTMSRKKEEFVPLEEGTVRMYVCGITPYDHSHIGHARSCVAFDVVRRYLEYKGYRVLFVQNFTDVDDKIIRKAKEEGVDYKTISQRYIEAFFEDIVKPLGILPATVYPKVSDHIPDIISFVEKLVEKGHAYVLENGDVFFHVPSFPEYGKLSHQKLEELNRHRIEPDPRKRDPKDFALWKAAKQEDYDTGAVFDSPWGPGRPGWHIECSVMSIKHLGETLDIHGGGKDLIFPHHENEIAQSEAATGKPFARYWMHNEFVTINGEKMSKSLGNIVAMRDLVHMFDPRVLRFFLATTHYRDPLDYNEDRIREAGRNLEKLYNTLEMLDAEIQASTIKEQDPEIEELATRMRTEFENAMDDDFDTSKATRVLFEHAGMINKLVSREGDKSRPSLERLLDTFLSLAGILGILGDFEKSGPLALREMEMIKTRENARRNREYELADSIRQELGKKGIVLYDTPRGTRWRKPGKPREPLRA